MGLLQDIKAFLKKHIKNPLLLGGMAYLVWKILSPRIKNENVRVLKKIGGSEIVFDDEEKSYYVIKGTQVIPAKTLVDAEKKASADIRVERLYEKVCLGGK